MKAIFYYRAADDTINIIAHDLEDSQVPLRMNALIAQGYKGILLDQGGQHNGDAARCPHCRAAAAAYMAQMNSVVVPKPVEREKAIGEGIEMVSSLRRDVPPEPRHRLNVRLPEIPLKAVLTPLIVVLLIIFLAWFMRGPGKPLYQAVLHSLSSGNTVPPTTILPTTVSVVAMVSPSPTLYNLIDRSTATQTATQKPSPTMTVTPVPTDPPATETPASSPASGCVSYEAVTVADVGKTICVTGKVLNVVVQTNGTYFAFSGKRGSFYFVSYDRPWSEAEKGACVRATGVIQQIGDSPIMVLDYHSEMGLCP